MQLQPFEQLLRDVLVDGEARGSRAGATKSLFAPQPLTFDTEGKYAWLITSKEVPWKMALREFMWMLSGSTNTADLAKSSPAMAKIWSNWANDFGDIGPTYGAQYRDAGGSFDNFYINGQPELRAGVDQLAQTIDRLAETPDTRRALISLWSAAELDQMALEPCMVLFQFSRRGPNLEILDLSVYQRSADMMLGVPFDLFQASFLLHAVARELRVKRGQQVNTGKITWAGGDVHLYANQLEPATLQVIQGTNSERMRARMILDAHPSLSILDGSFEPGNVKIMDYNPEPKIDGGKIAV